MFERIVKALEPFGLTVVIFAGLVLAERIELADRVIVGYATVFVGASLVVVHIINDIKRESNKKLK